MKKLIKPQFVHQSKGWMVVFKPATVPVQKDKTKDVSLQSLVESNLSKEVHIHTRLDRPVSGLVLLTTQKPARQHFVNLGESKGVTKRYLCVVKKGEMEAEGEFSHWLLHDKKRKRASISREKVEGAKAVKLKYKKIAELENYLVLDLHLESGKFHQIRSQLAFEGFPIKGDVKYGARRANKDRSIYLHAYGLEFEDPYGEQINLSFAPQEDTLWSLAWLAKNEKE